MVFLSFIFNLEKTVHHPSRHEEFILFADFERQIPKFVCIVRPSKKKMEILPLWWHLTNFDIDNILPRVTIWPKHPTLTLGIFVVDPHQQTYPTLFFNSLSIQFRHQTISPDKGLANNVLKSLFSIRFQIQVHLSNIILSQEKGTTEHFFMQISTRGDFSIS